MNGGTVAFAIAGLVGFLSGAYIASTGERGLGVSMMAMGLIFQMLALRNLKAAKRHRGEGEL